MQANRVCRFAGVLLAHTAASSKVGFVILLAFPYRHTLLPWRPPPLSVYMGCGQGWQNFIGYNFIDEMMYEILYKIPSFAQGR